MFTFHRKSTLVKTVKDASNSILPSARELLRELAPDNPLRKMLSDECKRLKDASPKMELHAKKDVKQFNHDLKRLKWIVEFLEERRERSPEFFPRSGLDDELPTMDARPSPNADEIPGPVDESTQETLPAFKEHTLLPHHGLHLAELGLDGPAQEGSPGLSTWIINLSDQPTQLRVSKHRGDQLVVAFGEQAIHPTGALVSPPPNLTARPHPSTGPLPSLDPQDDLRPLEQHNCDTSGTHPPARTFHSDRYSNPPPAPIPYTHGMDSGDHPVVQSGNVEPPMSNPTPFRLRRRASYASSTSTHTDMVEGSESSAPSSGSLYSHFQLPLPELVLPEPVPCDPYTGQYISNRPSLASQRPGDDWSGSIPHIVDANMAAYPSHAPPPAMVMVQQPDGSWSGSWSNSVPYDTGMQANQYFPRSAPPPEMTIQHPNGSWSNSVPYDASQYLPHIAPSSAFDHPPNDFVHHQQPGMVPSQFVPYPSDSDPAMQSDAEAAEHAQARLRDLNRLLDAMPSPHHGRSASFAPPPSEPWYDTAQYDGPARMAPYPSDDMMPMRWNRSAQATRSPPLVHPRPYVPLEPALRDWMRNLPQRQGSLSEPTSPVASPPPPFDRHVHGPGQSDHGGQTGPTLPETSLPVPAVSFSSADFGIGPITTCPPPLGAATHGIETRRPPQRQRSLSDPSPPVVSTRPFDRCVRRPGQDVHGAQAGPTLPGTFMSGGPMQAMSSDTAGPRLFTKWRPTTPPPPFGAATSNEAGWRRPPHRQESLSVPSSPVASPRPFDRCVRRPGQGGHGPPAGGLTVPDMSGGRMRASSDVGPRLFGLENAGPWPPCLSAPSRDKIEKFVPPPRDTELVYTVTAALLEDPPTTLEPTPYERGLGANGGSRVSLATGHEEQDGERLPQAPRTDLWLDDSISRMVV